RGQSSDRAFFSLYYGFIGYFVAPARVRRVRQLPPRKIVSNGALIRALHWPPGTYSPLGMRRFTWRESLMRNMLVNVTFAAASLCVQPVVSALAQPPGGQPPQTGQPTRPDPSMPNDTMTRPQTTPGSNADITQQAPARVDDKK